ncbi:hypothetical protein [Plantactinospora sp. KBS50]|uniref:hypothetical protein n=1 Tax=Plantactinospora sp. KBS50 TaxID=2024580 RepID=UPI000BAAEE10|nr:hypothetical protein [Plantactinospora sp. KBS50]ASW53254.1 hypothetical protein CIK06_02255 [Plantactinospora sp. KBS50]
MRTLRAAAFRLVAVLLPVVLVLGACGSGPTAQVWAATVCQALTPWRTEINKLTSVTQQQMTAKTTPAQAKENLVRLLGGAEEATETARKKIDDAGVPDAEQGESVAHGFVASLAAVRDAYGRAREAIEALPIDQPDVFYDGVQTIVERLATEYRASSVETTKLNSKELERAFDEVPECR